MSTVMSPTSPYPVPVRTVDTPVCVQEAQWEVHQAVRRALAAGRHDDGRLRIAIAERSDGTPIVYVSTIGSVEPWTRSGVRVVVRDALAGYTPRAPDVDVVFLRRREP